MLCRISVILLSLVLLLCADSRFIMLRQVTTHKALRCLIWPQIQSSILAPPAALAPIIARALQPSRLNEVGDAKPRNRLRSALRTFFRDAAGWLLDTLQDHPTCIKI